MFVDQAGVPLVSLSSSCRAGHATVTLSQSRYTVGSGAASAAPPLWQLPVCLRTSAGRPACELLDQPKKDIAIDSCPAWTIANAGGRGYYRTRLDRRRPEGGRGQPPGALRPRAADPAGRRVGARARRHRERRHLPRAGVRLRFRKSAPVLASLTGSLRSIDAELTTPETRPAFHDWVRRLLGPSAAALGWNNARAASSDNDRTLRAALLRQLGEAGDPGAVETARRLVDQELATPKSTDPTLLEVAVNVAAANGDAALYEQYQARSRSAVDPEDRYRFLYGLTRFSAQPLVRRTMEYALGPEVRTQDTKLVISSLLANPAARDAVWDLVRDRWDAVQKKTGAFVGNTVIVGGLSSFCDTRHAAEIKAFFAAHPVPDAERTLTQALERINACAALAAAQAPKLTDWLRANR